ncbi:SDR family oxidoreductase [Mycolicibacter sinensis]|uniref:3-beta hydroxysteroid dehydrogenase n=1 Tax=Mycolicibacter sinensis (strain JDM601) TaxID=875328 RepID=A0A1A2YAT2_MYCSD|nr:SDR family oxidoreductase [Mycolicibacter sinensis]OBH16234.1 3-beta hydroxysteroid dehydrogenase [Mycolicibacter sinensis]OBI34563.1 3-beta hydroxysteroid dehydrogenase [Mycolicibacter sinensis]
MRVFVTGASGGIGSAVVTELVAAGHQPVGLARSDASAALLRRLGAEAVFGGLADLEILRKAADAADGVIHLAFSNDFTNLEASIEAEAGAVAALGDALVGTGKPLVLAAGTPAVPGRASTEDDPPVTEGPMGGRGRTAQAVLKLAEHGVRSALVRLPRSVHEAGGRFGFASMLIAAARRTGISGYVGDGTQRWPAVHRLDAARLFRIALEDAPAGSVLHAVADQGDPMRAIAEVIGDQLQLPVQPVAAESYGVLGAIFALDQPSSSALTRARFDWQPSHPSLLDDLRAGGYPD